MARPTYLLQVGFASAPSVSIAATTWTDISSYLDVQAGVKIGVGRADEVGEVSPSKLAITLNNRDGRFTMGRSSSPYYPNVMLGKRIRLGVTDPVTATFSWRFTGFVTAWPLQWIGGPAAYAEAKVEAVDPTGRLGDLGEFQTLLREDVLDDSPLAYYPMGESFRSVIAGDISGNNQPSLAIRQIGAGGSLNFGSKDTASGAHTMPAFYSETETSVGFNAVDNTNGKYLHATLKAPTSAAATGASVAVWAVESTLPLTTGPLAVLSASDGSWFGVTKAGSGNITAEFYNATTGTTSVVSSGVGLSTDQALLYAAVLDIPSAGNGRITFMINGVAFGAAVTFPMAFVPSWREVSAGGRGKQLFRGNLSHAQFYARPITTNVLIAQYAAGAFGSDGTGDTTSSRATKIAGFSGLGAVTTAYQGTFAPQAMGPQEVAGNPLDALQAVEAVEDSILWVKGDGTVELQLRNLRFNAAAALTLAADKLDPDALTFRGDDYLLFNDATASTPSGATVRVLNQASKNAYGARKTQLTALTANDDQLVALAGRRAYGLGTQRNRITGVKVSLLNDKALIASVLALKLSSKITITTLPSAQSPATSVSVMIEGWDEIIGENEWTMAFNTSPAEPWTVWQLGVAGRSELGTTTVLAY